MKVRIGGLAALMMLLVAACDPPHGSSPTPDPAHSSGAVATTGADADGYPAAQVFARNTKVGTVDGVPVWALGDFAGSCSPLRLARLVTGFVDSIASDRPAALAFVGPGFEWYSADEEGPRRRHFEATTRDEFAHYLAGRQGRHERQRAVAVKTRPAGNFVAALVRLADDLPPGLGGPERLAFAKGRFDCDRRAVTAFSSAMHPAGSESGEPYDEFGSSPRRLRAMAARALASLRAQD